MNDTMKEADPKVMDLLYAIALKTALLKDMRESLDTLKSKLKLFIGDDAGITHNGVVVCTYRQNADRRVVDTKKLQQFYPKIYEACLKPAKSSRTLVVLT